MNRFITHRRRLADVEESTARFLLGARRLKEKLGPILVQLPPSLERDDGLLARFLGLIRESEPGGDLRYTFEFRNISWQADEVYQALEKANCALCWNSNPDEVDENGSIAANFALLQPWIRSCHINRVAAPGYPWRELFTLLREAGYDRFTLAEIQDSPDRERLLTYYRALWQELNRP